MSGSNRNELAPQESKSSNSTMEDVEKMNLEELRVFVGKNKKIDQGAFGDDFDALAAHIGVVERARERLKDEEQMARALLESTQDESVRKNKKEQAEREQKEHEDRIIAESEEAEKLREDRLKQQPIDDRFSIINLQIGDFNERCEQALKDAKECYPAPFFGENKALLAQKKRLIEMVDAALQSSPELAQRGDPLDTTPFHQFIAYQKDAVTQKRLAKLAPKLNPLLAAARERINMLVLLYSSPTKQEEARQKLNIELDGITKRITKESDLEQLSQFNARLAGNLELIGSQEDKKRQKRMELFQAAQVYIDSCGQKGLPKRSVGIHFAAIDELNLKARETEDTKPLKDYNKQLQELSLDLDFLNELNIYESFHRDKSVNRIPEHFTQNNTTGFILAANSKQLRDEMPRMREEYQAKLALKQQEEGQALAADKLAREKSVVPSSGGLFGTARRTSLDGFDPDETPIVIHTAKSKKDPKVDARHVPSGAAQHKSLDPKTGDWYSLDKGKVDKKEGGMELQERPKESQDQPLQPLERRGGMDRSSR